ncbi:MAG: methionyl-tRNA formyltransferase [Acidobacteriota bacterium]
MKLIFMGTPAFAVPILLELLNARHEILSVFTQPDRPVGRKQTITAQPVKLFAIDRGIPVLQPTKIRTAEAHAEIEPLLKQADAIVVAAYGRILPAWILSAPPNGAFNVHSSILPKYRGAAPINWAIANGETETGITIMQMDEGLDTGPILLQRMTDIAQSETAPELTDRLSIIGAELMVEALARLEQNELSPTPQDHSAATLAPMLKREDGQIEWQLTSAEILNRQRAFTPFPGSYTIAADRRLEIVRALSENAVENEAESGTITETAKDSFVVQCGRNSQLRVTEVQPEGRRVMPARDFLNAGLLKTGMRLG